MEPRKEAICDALARWIKQRPGLEYANYGDRTSYRAECRSIARDKREAETLLAAVRWRDGITADDLIKAAKGAYSGRMTIRESTSTTVHGIHAADTVKRSAAIDYCTGQYWPTEYRRAVCAVLASALWEYTREHAMPAPTRWRVRLWNGDGERATTTKLMQIGEACETLNKAGGEKAGYIQEFYGPSDGGPWVPAGDWLRAHFRKEFGRGIASRWFT